jgi:hypothetical protein
MNRSETMYRSLPTLQHADGHKVTVGVKAYGGDGQPCRLPMDDITVEHWPVGRCVASPLGLGRSLHSHRNDAATTGESDPAITRSIAVFDGLRTTDAD